MTEYENIRPLENKKAATMSAYRKLTLAAFAASMLAMTGCGSLRSDEGLKTASVENDYRVRHPITMAEAEHTLDIPIGSGDRRLNSGLEDTIRGFVQDYHDSASGAVQIAVPAGSVNAAAARAALPQVRSVLIRAGIKANRIIATSYAAPAPEVSAPIRLTFIAITAMTNQCGQWPEDLMNNSMENKNWYNFGCANQNNLAAQVANPEDLFNPRARTPIDAERRANAIDSYRTSGASLGGDTSISIPSQ